MVRENTEGEYSAVGGRLFEGTEREMAMQQSIFTRKGVDRIMKFAFELAMQRPRKEVTSATKSNGISITMPYWDERFAAMAKNYPQIKTSQYHIDGLTIQMVLNPQRFDVIVASNLFGDILSDLGPATAGTIGIAPSGNINPERQFSLAVRTGARFGAGYLRQEDRQPGRPDLVGRDAARTSRPSAGRRGNRQGDRTVPAVRAPHPGCRRQGEYRRHGQGHRGRNLNH